MLTSLALMAFVVHAEQPKEAEAIKKDLAKLQGRWVLVRLIEKGKTHDPKGTDFRGLTVTFNGEKALWKEESELLDFVIVIDPKVKPSKIDLTFQKHPELQGTNHAIYDFVDDELWIALGTWVKPNEVRDRPPNFVYRSTDGPRAKFVFILKREKK